MEGLLNLWTSYTGDFSAVQKLIVGVVLAFILCISMLAIVLLFLEITA